MVVYSRRTGSSDRERTRFPVRMAVSHPGPGPGKPGLAYPARAYICVPYSAASLPIKVDIRTKERGMKEERREKKKKKKGKQRKKQVSKTEKISHTYIHITCPWAGPHVAGSVSPKPCHLPHGKMPQLGETKVFAHTSSSQADKL